MIKNYLLKTVNKYVKEYFENIDDMEYGLLKGEVKMKNTFFKENALKKITSLLFKKSKIEEIDVKYNWSLFGEATVFVKLQNVLLNLHPGGKIETTCDKTPGLDIKNININIDIYNLVVNFDDFTFKISHLSFVTSELISRKAVKIKDLALFFNDKKVLYIPSIEGDVSFSEIIKLCVFIRMIRIEIDANTFEVMLKYSNLLLNGTFFPPKEQKRKNKINLVCNIRSILIDFTDIGKRICLNTTSLALTNKVGFWIERIRGFDIRYMSRFKSKIKHFKPKKLLDIRSFSLDKKTYTFKHCFLDHKLIASLDSYYKIVQTCQVSSISTNGDKSTFVIKDCKFVIDSNDILVSNCLLEIYVHKSSFKIKLSIDSLLLDDFLKAESVKIGYENNKIYSEAVNIFLNLEELNLKRTYRSYLKYCAGEGSLYIDIMSHLSNFKIVYGPKTKLIEVDNLIIDFNSLDNSGKTPLVSIESDSKCIFEVFDHKNNMVCCLSDLFLDLKVLKKFNNDFLLPRENDINYIIKHFKSVKKANECRTKVYLYNVNLGYEELRLNIEFFEFNSIINTIFTVFLDDGNHIIVDSATVKLLVGDILQFQITNNLRVNITNSILKKINKFFVDIKNIIILSIKEDEDSISSISWILDVESISFNVFDMNLNEILAAYVLKTKICNVKEHDGDETVRKLYLKINDVQIDNQIMKNTYPVLLHKTKSNDIIEGNLLYYYNNSTLFIKKTDVKFGEMRLNIEGKHLENILAIFKFENVESTSLKTNVESFMNTCVTVKDFHIGDLNVKINYLMKSGDNLKDKMLFFVMNNISDFNLSIDKLKISHYRTDMNGLFEIVYGFYKNEIYNNLFKVVGHIDLLGNVGTLTNTISGTIKENVKKKTGFFKGSKILLKNTFLGVTNTLGKISTSVKNNANLLTFDKEFADTSEFHPYAYDVHLPLPFRQNENNLNLIMKGTEKLISSVYSGVLGVAKKPYNGSTSGVGGVIVGFGKGVIGAISKPVVGASELFSNCVQCVGGGPVVIRRMMYPMYTVDKIDKYDIDQASSFYIFVSFLNKLEGEEFLDGSFGHFRGGCLLILTNLRLIVTTEISVFEFDPFEIDIDTKEMNKFTICREEVVVNKKRFIKNLCEFLM